MDLIILGGVRSYRIESDGVRVVGPDGSSHASDANVLVPAKWRSGEAANHDDLIQVRSNNGALIEATVGSAPERLAKLVGVMA